MPHASERDVAPPFAPLSPSATPGAKAAQSAALQGAFGAGHFHASPGAPKAHEELLRKRLNPGTTQSGAELERLQLIDR
jgi:hypothetical protein